MFQFPVETKTMFMAPKSQILEVREKSQRQPFMGNVKYQSPNSHICTQQPISDDYVHTQQ
jgi:hypothetical protein